MARLRPSPWWLLLEVANVAHVEWRELSPADRRKLTRLAVKSRGLPTNLTPRERAEIKRIVAQVDLKRMARDLLPKAVRRRVLP